jgi:hypothetical protein
VNYKTNNCNQRIESNFKIFILNKDKTIGRTSYSTEFMIAFTEYFLYLWINFEIWVKTHLMVSFDNLDAVKNGFANNPNRKI